MGTSARSYELVTLEELKGWLGIDQSDKTDDTILTMLIRASTDFIEGQLVGVDEMNGGYCNRRFFATDYTSALYTGNGRAKLQLRQYPINSITTIVVDETTIFPDGTNTLADLDIYVSTEDAGTIINLNTWSLNTPNNIVLTYNGGHANIPADLKMGAMSLAALRWDLKGKEAFKSEKIGMYSYTLADLNAENPFGNGLIKDMIDPFRKPAL